MTERQVEKLRNTIKAIKADLAADKRRHGGFYDDSRGLRYVQLQYYIKLGDYRGAATFLRWFQKNFPDDVCYSVFLFEWTLVLFMTGKIKETEQKAFETYTSNTYAINVFFDKSVVPTDPYDNGAGSADMVEDFPYKADQLELAAFSEWLLQLVSTVKFQEAGHQYVALQKALNEEGLPRKRSVLIRKADKLVMEFTKTPK